MRFDWWTFGFETVNVLVLVLLLGHFLFKPIAAIIAARQAEATKGMAEAAAMREALEVEKRKAAAAAAEIAAGRAAAMRAAETEAAARKTALLAEAREDGDRLREAARHEIAQTRAEETVEAGGRASRLAVDIAARLMDRMPPNIRVGGFIDGLADAVAALPVETRAEIGGDGAPLRVTAARPPDAAELAALREKLARALGRPIETEILVDEKLIAGLEIDTPHAIVRNSLRADLAQIMQALEDDSHD